MLRNIDLTEAEWTLMEQLWGCLLYTSFAARHAVFHQVDRLKSDPPLFEPALGLFRVKALRSPENLNIQALFLQHPFGLGLVVRGKQKRSARVIDLDMSSHIARCV